MTQWHPVFIVIVLLATSVWISPSSASDRAAKAIEQRTPVLRKALNDKELRLGAPIFIRIFKQEAELEVFLKGPDGQFTLFKTYPICAWSGALGPKQRQGDRQSPEGFYFVTPSQMNPHSRFHLSFNLGYPNAYDRAHNRTGDYLMVHGRCVSIGCYAMTDPVIEDIWTLANAAFDGGQPFFRVHIFPFRMTDENMASHSTSEWANFWKNLKQGYDWFEAKKTPPNVKVHHETYVFDTYVPD